MAARRPLVAVVDDEESVRRAVARMLVASEFDVEVFASGQEFLNAVQQRRPDCVILDFQMPGLTGREVQRRLGLAQIRLPIIVVTAHDQAGIREQCLADGALAYLAKPLQRAPLVALIDEAVRPRAGSA